MYSTSQVSILISSTPLLYRSRLASKTTNPTTSSAPSARSPAIPVAIAVVAVVGGVMLFSKGKTGEVDNLGKAMAKTATPANSSGGLGSMEADVGRKFLLFRRVSL